MATKTSMIASGINGMIRIPMISAGLASASLTLEGAYRILTTAFSVIGVKADTAWVQKLNSYVPHLAVNVLRPFGNLSHKEVAVSATACILIGTAGWELANKLCGSASDRYNLVADHVSPVKVDTKWRQPFVRAVVDYFYPSKKEEPRS